MKTSTNATLAAAGAAALMLLQNASAQPTLTGWAVLPANTFSDGPTSGQFAGPGAGGTRCHSSQGSRCKASRPC